jgi:GAF domain-containing protein
MEHEDLGGRLADLARDIRSRGDVAAATDEITAVAAQMAGKGASAAISLAHRQHRVETPSATSSLARRGDALQYELAEGPCLDTVWTQKQVYAADLTHDDRWPRWAPRVVRELGVRSMLCTQMFTNEDQVGALNVYSPEVDAFDQDAQDTAVLLAAHAAVAVAAAQQIDTLKVAVDRRTTIGTAVGMLMILHDLDADQAFAVLRRLSSERNRKIYALAEDVIRLRRLPQH